MRIVVTGASGFVGRHMIEHLARQGHAVTAMVRAGDGELRLDPELALDVDPEVAQRVSVVGGCLEDDQFVDAHFAGAKAVIHLAAKRQSPSEAELVQVNARLTGQLARAAARAPELERFVYLSCLAAAQPEPPPARRAPATRTRSTRVSRYARSKRLGEERVLALAESVPVTVIRAPLVYGPRDRGNLAMFKHMKRRVVPLPAKGRDPLSVVFVDDLCDALSLAAVRAHPSGSVFDVSDGVTLTWRQFTAVVGEALGRQSRAVGVPYWMFSLASRTPRRTQRPQPVAMLQTRKEWRQRDWTCGPDGSHDIEAALGWRPVTSLEEGIARTTLWYRDAGWL